MISVENLYIKEIDRTISVKFSKGINFLKGSNGSGKTLLLDYLSGLRKLKNKKNIKKTNSWFLVLLFFSIVYYYYSYFWSMYSIYIGENPVGTDSLVPYEFFWEDKYNY